MLSSMHARTPAREPANAASCQRRAPLHGGESGQRFGGAAFPWREQSIKDLGTGLAGRRKDAQAKGRTLAKKLKPGDFFAVQARERWSTAEVVHERPGHFWVAQTRLSGPCITVAEKRMTVNGTIFAKDDIMIWVGRYFDRDVADPTGLTFEEWQPLTVFSQDDVGKTLTIDGGAIKVNRIAQPHTNPNPNPPNPNPLNSNSNPAGESDDAARCLLG